MPEPATSPVNVITGSLLSVTLPAVTEKSVESNDATPFIVVLASFAEIVTVLFVIVVSIGSVPTNVRTSERRFTVSVPVSPAIERTVATFTVPAAVN